MNFDIEGLRSKDQQKIQIVCQLYEAKNFKQAQANMKKYLNKLEEGKGQEQTEVLFLKELIDFQLSNNEQKLIIIQQCKEKLRKNLKMSFAWETLGIMLKEIKNFNESATHFLMAVKLKPQRWQIALEASNLLILKEQYSKLVDLREGIINQSKDSIENWCYIIQAHYLQGSYQKALDYITQLKQHLQQHNKSLQEKFFKFICEFQFKILIEQKEYKNALRILLQEKIWFKDKIFYYEKLAQSFEECKLIQEAIECYSYLNKINSNNYFYLQKLIDLQKKIVYVQQDDLNMNEVQLQIYQKTLQEKFMYVSLKQSNFSNKELIIQYLKQCLKKGILVFIKLIKYMNIYNQHQVIESILLEHLSKYQDDKNKQHKYVWTILYLSYYYYYIKDYQKSFEFSEIGFDHSPTWSEIQLIYLKSQIALGINYTILKDQIIQCSKLQQDDRCLNQKCTKMLFQIQDHQAAQQLFKSFMMFGDRNDYWIMSFQKVAFNLERALFYYKKSELILSLYYLLSNQKNLSLFKEDILEFLQYSNNRCYLNPMAEIIKKQNTIQESKYYQLNQIMIGFILKELNKENKDLNQFLMQQVQNKKLFDLNNTFDSYFDQQNYQELLKHFDLNKLQQQTNKTIENIDLYVQYDYKQKLISLNEANQKHKVFKDFQLFIDNKNANSLKQLQILLKQYLLQIDQNQNNSNNESLREIKAMANEMIINIEFQLKYRKIYKLNLNQNVIEQTQSQYINYLSYNLQMSIQDSWFSKAKQDPRFQPLNKSILKKEKISDKRFLKEKTEEKVETNISQESQQENEDQQEFEQEDLVETQQDPKIYNDNSSAWIAMQNYDWRYLKSKEIYFMFQSFIKTLYPNSDPSEWLLKVEIFQSNFGSERLKIEQEEGPLRFLKDGINFDEKGNQTIDPKVLRQYELERLKYFYGVIHFSTKFVAEKIYDHFDNQEIEFSSCILDLRFLPENLTINSEPVETCYELNQNETIKIKSFITHAQGHTDLKLSWDTENNQKNQDEIKQQEESDTEELIDKNELMMLRQSLLNTNEERKQEVQDDVDITFKVGFEDFEDDSNNEHKKEKLTKRQFVKQLKDKKQIWQQEKRVKENQDNQLKLLVSNKQAKEKDQEVDLTDKRFWGLAENPDFWIEQGKAGVDKEYINKIKKIKKE